MEDRRVHPARSACPTTGAATAAAKIKTLLFKFIANTNTRINQLKSGEVDMVVMFPWDKHREVAAIPGVRVQRTDGNGYEHVTLNQRAVPGLRRRARAPGADPRGRPRAHRRRRSSKASRRSPTARCSRCRGPTTRRCARYPFDQARARALLDEAGWRDSNGDGVRDKDGQRFAFTLITQAGFAVRENVAQVLQRQFTDVGVEAAVQLHDGTSISKLWFEGKFDAMLHWWQMPADPELTLFFAKDRTPPRGRNINYVVGRRADARWSTPPIAPSSRAERTRLLGEAQARIAELAVEIPLYGVTQARRRAGRGSQGFNGNPTNTGPFWNVHEWTAARRRVVRSHSACGALVEAVPLLLVVSGIAFGLLQLVPGGPLEVYLSNPGVRPEDLERLRRALGLDRPLWEQYVSWLAAFVRGDWGYSFSDGRPVLARVVERLPASLELLGGVARAGAGRGVAGRDRRAPSRARIAVDRVDRRGRVGRHVASRRSGSA